MADEAIFFPYVQVPDDDWFTRVLLYWDRVSAVIPGELHGNADELGAHTVDLMAHDLVHGLRPEFHVLSRPGFSESFLELIDADADIQEARSDPDRWETSVPVYTSKLGLSLMRALEERGLARSPQIQKGDLVVEIERTTAFRFMGYVALFLRNERGRAFDPVTDDPAMLEVLQTPVRDGAPPPRTIGEVRLALLEAALPLPKSIPPPVELADFKRAHGSDLSNFRRAIERTAAVIAGLGHKEHQTALLNAEGDLLMEQLRLTERRIQELGRGTKLGALSLLIATATPLVPAAVDPSPLTLIGAVAGALATATAYLSREAIAGPRRQSDEPLAYAVLAKRQLGE